MPDYEAEEWRVRVEATKEAQRRTRYTFIVVTIVSIAIFIAQYNSVLSWYRNFALHPILQDQALKQPFPGTPNPLSKEDVERSARLTKHVRDRVVDSFVDSTTVSFGLIGVKFGISDISALGSLTIWVISIWFYFAARRENHVIGDLVLDVADSTDDRLRRLILHGIISQTVFNTLSTGETPISTLDHRKVKRPPPSKSLRKTFTMLIFLPFATILLIIVTDLISLIEPAVFRYPHDILAMKLGTGEVIQLVIMEEIALIFCVLTFQRCYGVYSFLTATQNLMVDFAQKVGWPEREMAGAGATIVPPPPPPARRRRRGESSSGDRPAS